MIQSIPLFFVIGMFFIGPGLHAEDAAGKSPNFVVIVTDDQSWVGTSLLVDPSDADSKSDYYQTPNIERIGSMGMRFIQGYAPAPFCCPTRRSLLVGQTPARHVYQRDQTNWTQQYRKQLTLPQMLKQSNAAYQTAHFGKWDFRTDEVTPGELGYDVSDGYTSNGTGGGKGSGAPAATEDPKLIFGITKRSCDFMEEQVKNGNPFFVQVSHYAVHLDIFYRAETLTQTQQWTSGKKHNLPQFAAMTSDVDDGIGILLDKLRALGIQDNTYIFFLSDNGGRLTMPGQKGEEQPRNYPLRDGKGSMYEGGIRVPFVVIGPGIEPDSVSRVPVTGLDIFPTIAELAGYNQTLPAALDGGSMIGVLTGKGEKPVKRTRPFLLFHQAVDRKPQTALRLGDYKLVKTWEGDRLELFDLSQSPGEQDDLAKKLPEKTRELHEQMVGFLNEVNAETRKTMQKGGGND